LAKSRVLAAATRQGAHTAALRPTQPSNSASKERVEQMIARFLSLWDNVRSSLWATPLAISALCAILAIAALTFKPPWTGSIAWLYAGNASQAPEFTSSLVGAMITLTALAFSITMVVLTLAAQQLGPRLIQIFMSDLQTKMSLGLFLGTIIYLLLVLRALGGSSDDDAPSLAITGGTALVLASTVTLLFFVHSLARSIASDNVVARVGDTLDNAILELFPKEPQLGVPPPAPRAPIAWESYGYVQRIDYDVLANAAAKADALLVLDFYPGRHLLRGEARAWRIGGDDEALRSALDRAVVVSSQRTLGQDPEWSVRQLVEIALRALSPGINDEFTAIAVIERLALSLSLLLSRADAPSCWEDHDGVARVFGPSPTFASMLISSCGQIIEAAADKPYVRYALAFNLRKLAALADETRRRLIIEQLDCLIQKAGDACIDGPGPALGSLDATPDAPRSLSARQLP
jgi:uncharacterized membrane protein